MLLTLFPVAEIRAAAGSWIVNAPAMQVAVPGRQYLSAELAVPESVTLADRRLVSLSWRYQVPPGRRLQAWLCQGVFCMVLPGERGSRQTGLPTDVSRPWQFRLNCRPGERQAVRVTGAAARSSITYDGGYQGNRPVINRACLEITQSGWLPIMGWLTDKERHDRHVSRHGGSLEVT
ncbi:flagellar protein FlhE, partial [Oceanisphaera arctica]|uniref:flagellar protein FlhE n=1 Tax=Oceanisphaera arctica TaxID=641510 RepID=UPI0015E2A56D